MVTGFIFHTAKTTKPPYGDSAINSQESPRNADRLLCRAITIKGQRDSKELSARVALGYDVAGEKQERKSEALAKMEAEKTPCAFQSLPLNTLSVRSCPLEAPRYTPPPYRQRYKPLHWQHEGRGREAAPYR
jgi:hypothetical protein